MPKGPTGEMKCITHSLALSRKRSGKIESFNFTSQHRQSLARSSLNLQNVTTMRNDGLQIILVGLSWRGGSLRPIGYLSSIRL